MMCMFTTVTNNVRPNYLSVRPKLSLFGHVSMQNQIVIFSTALLDGSTHHWSSFWQQEWEVDCPRTCSLWRHKKTSRSLYMVPCMFVHSWHVYIDTQLGLKPCIDRGVMVATALSLCVCVWAVATYLMLSDFLQLQLTVNNSAIQSYWGQILHEGHHQPPLQDIHLDCQKYTII